MRRNITSIVIFLLYISQVLSQEIKIDAEIRTRAEFRDGFRKPLPKSENPAFVNNLRTKLNVFYASDDIKAKISLIDTRTYGKTTTSSTGDGLGVLEAWGEYNIIPELSFVLGRQGLEYDDKRIFSYNNWNNTPGAHDLLRIKFLKNGFDIQAGAGYNNAGDSIQYLSPYKQSYKTLTLVRAEKSFSLLSTSAIWVNDSHELGETNNIKHVYRNTLGAYLWLTNKDNPFNFLANIYYQFGRDKKDKSLSAYLLSLRVEQRLKQNWKAYAGVDVFSGSKNKNSNTDKTFNKLYGTNHAFNGSIEYWSTLPTQGLIDLHIGTDLYFNKKWDASLAFHHFSSNKAINEDDIKNIGSEIDLTVNYKINKELSVQGGWSCYFTTKGTDILKKNIGIDTHFPQWAYIQVAFKPIFMNKK